MNVRLGFAGLLRWPAVLLIGLGMLQVACSGPNQVNGKTSGEAPPAQAAYFTLSKEQVAHVRVIPAGRTTWSIAVHTTGTVDWDADHTTQAITQVNGPISRILVDTGSVVHQNDPLLYVSSPDMANAVSTYRKAQNRLELARRSLRRSQELLDHGVAAVKDVESAQADFNDAGTDVQNSLQALKIFGITEAEIKQAERQGVPISPELAVRAPIAGTIVQKLVSPGQLIQAGATTCFVLTDNSTVWVQGHIFDRDLPAVRVGDTVEETNASLPEMFHGVISDIGALMDPATRTTPVRIVTRNPGLLLKKDMFVEAIIHTRTRKGVLSVPVSAVLRDAQNEPFVYVEVQPDKFAQRLIRTGIQQDDSIEVLDGIREGDMIVSEGSIFLQFANSYE